jgi:hypothetical protein
VSSLLGCYALLTGKSLWHNISEDVNPEQHCCDDLKCQTKEKLMVAPLQVCNMITK